MKFKISNLIERRSRNGAWRFVVGALLTSLLVLWYLADIGAAPITIFWVLIPLAVFIAHIAYPTILGWFIISSSWAAYTAVRWYSVVFQAQGDDSIPGLIIVIIFTGLSYLLARGYPK